MKALKYVLVFVISLLAGSILSLWYSTYVMGRYYASAGFFFTVLGVLVPVITVVGAFLLARFIWRADLRGFWSLFVLFVSIPATQGCDHANANVQTLITNDCGVSWTLVKAGEIVPSRIGPCAYKVTIPDYPMSGETKFRASFDKRVLANIEVSYEYSIVDGKTFIGEAKYIGKANSETDDVKNSAAAYETAENVVIDKRIREAASKELLKEDIVEFDQGVFEDKLLVASNELLKTKGVRLNFISFVPTPEEQTRLAIDMMTAMKIYQLRGLEDLGKQAAIARAGAAKINLTQTPPVTPPAQGD